MLMRLRIVELGVTDSKLLIGQRRGVVVEERQGHGEQGINLIKSRLKSITLPYKHIRGLNTREGKELFKLKKNIRNRTNGYTLAMNKIRLETRRCLSEE